MILLCSLNVADSPNLFPLTFASVRILWFLIISSHCRYTLDRKEDDKDYRNLLAMLHRVNELRMATVEQKPEVVLKKFADAGVFTLLFNF